MAPFGASRAGLMSVAEDDIPDSVVSRDPDNETDDSQTGQRGLVFEVASDRWGAFGAELSSNTSEVTRAYIYQKSDGQLLADTDISDLSSGDTFTLDVDLDSNTEYNFVLDAEGAEYNQGADLSPDFPYSSNDGEITLKTGAVDATDDVDIAYLMIKVGNVGFD